MAKIKISPHIKDEGFPTSSKNYDYAHRKANEAEKKKYGKKQYDEVTKMVRKLKPKELLGKTTKSGQIIIEKKVPKKYRPEIAYHEKTEYKRLKK